MVLYIETAREMRRPLYEMRHKKRFGKMCIRDRFYDGYIAFEGTQTAKAEKLGVSANGMNLSIKESAKAEEVIATVHILSLIHI